MEEAALVNAEDVVRAQDRVIGGIAKCCGGKVLPLPATALGITSACVLDKPQTFIIFPSPEEVTARCSPALKFGMFPAIQLQAEAGC